jgi:hypothetical protein
MHHPPRFLPPGTVTDIGSLPFRDPPTAVQCVAQTCPCIPFWPELPLAEVLRCLRVGWGADGAMGGTTSSRGAGIHTCGASGVCASRTMRLLMTLFVSGGSTGGGAELVVGVL